MKLTSFFPLSSKEKLLTTFWVIFSLLLFLYSFTQIDLGLVVSRYPFFYAIEKSFQYIGYFRRDVSTEFFIAIITLGFLLFGWTLLEISKQHVGKKAITVICILVFLFLAFSYNAFSYDFFNYIFDAKILTHYHLNPYQQTALNFPQDPMLGFMHWTHRTYPYGPLWLGLTIPLSYIGGNIFIITFFLFKILSAIAYSLFIYFLYKVLEIFDEKRALFLTTFVALNPFFLAEFLVSAHNDSSMFALGFAAIYMLLKRKQLFAYGLLLLSIGIKFATGFFIPAFFLVSWNFMQKRPFSTNLFRYTLMFFMIVAFALVSYRTVFQPWYLIYVIPFMLFFPWKKETGLIVFLMSILSLGYYSPFLLTGSWDESVLGNLLFGLQMSVFPICLVLLIVFYFLQLLYVFIYKKK
jgi:hypothetical protein